jgi:hypothetical protein
VGRGRLEEIQNIDSVPEEAAADRTGRLQIPTPFFSAARLAKTDHSCEPLFRAAQESSLSAAVDWSRGIIPREQMIDYAL